MYMYIYISICDDTSFKLKKGKKKSNFIEYFYSNIKNIYTYMCICIYIYSF